MTTTDHHPMEMVSPLAIQLDALLAIAQAVAAELTRPSAATVWTCDDSTIPPYLHMSSEEGQA